MEQKLIWQKPVKRNGRRVTKRKNMRLFVEASADALAELLALPTVEAQDFPLPKTFRRGRTTVVLPSGLTYTVLYMAPTGKQYDVKEGDS